MNQIVARTQLRERLNSLPSEDFENLDGELDALLALAGSSEAEGLTLREFAELLRTHFADDREVRPSRSDSIQLITSQKAKGSEWQAVIVPFLTRDIRPPPFRYPRLIKRPDSDDWMVLLDRSDYTSDVKDLLERESRQEMERLLYVALTRARHTLVLAFDNELFAKKGGEIHSHSQSKWLKADKGAPNETAFANAAIDPASCGITGDYYKTRRKDTGQTEHKLPVEKISKAAAIRNASIFVRKLNPSGLPVDEIEERWTRADRWICRAPRAQHCVTVSGGTTRATFAVLSRPALSGRSEATGGRSAAATTMRRQLRSLKNTGRYRPIQRDPSESGNFC